MEKRKFGMDTAFSGALLSIVFQIAWVALGSGRPTRRSLALFGFLNPAPESST